MPHSVFEIVPKFPTRLLGLLVSHWLSCDKLKEWDTVKSVRHAIKITPVFTGFSSLSYNFDFKGMVATESNG